MRKIVKQPTGFDQDYLWLFVRWPRVAFCLSQDYQIVAVTERTRQLLGLASTSTGLPDLETLLARQGLKLAWAPKEPTPAITQLPDNEPSEVSRLLTKGPWTLTAKHTKQGGKVVGFILSLTEPADYQPPNEVNPQRNPAPLTPQPPPNQTEVAAQETLFPERAAKFINQLAGSIAHELRTPLAIIGINVDLLECKLGTQLTCEQQKHFKTTKYAIRLASLMIDNLLTMIRTIACGAPVQNNHTPLSMVESVHNILNIYPFLNHEQQLVNFKPCSDFIYYGDKTLTQYLLFNLIKNALTSIKEANKGTITISLKTTEKYHQLIITDTALGISKTNIRRIFDQLALIKTGVGLGLAFCKIVMHSYHGNISCQSVLGKYAKFILSFPKTCTQLTPLNTK